MPAVVAQLPALNAVLNAASGILLIVGYLFIRRQQVVAHKCCMLSALVVSMLFLGSYLLLRYVAGFTRFTGQGWIRPVYFTILISHTALAAAIPPLSLVTVWRGLSGCYDRHIRIARWTLPLWLYVSVTGVLVYWMLYRLYPNG